MKRIEQRDHFLASSHMREVRTRAERRLVEIVERGQSARKEFAIDDALGETFDAAKPMRLANSFHRPPGVCCAKALERRLRTTTSR